MRAVIRRELRFGGQQIWLCVAACAVVLVFAVRAEEPPAPVSASSAYESDLNAFFTEVDSTYPFFDLKGIREEWNAAKQRLAEQVKGCSSDEAFLGIVMEGIRRLHDSHMGIQDAKAALPPFPKEYFPGVSFMPATGNRVVVMWADEKYGDALKPGVIVSKIDGQDARSVLEERSKAVWDAGFCSGKQRARLMAYRIALKGKEGDTHVINYLVQGEERELTVTSEFEARGWPHVYNMPPDAARVGRSFMYTKLSDGAGYMYLRRVDDSAVPGMREAVETYPDAKGWILDLRGNGGGGYDEALIERVKALPRPVAVLIDAGCMSAGETLARDLARDAEARLFGSRTAGASSAKQAWKFPSGIASVVIPTRSRWRNDGQPIEFNGIEPDVEVEAVPEEVANGLNSEILRAQEYLAQTAKAGAAAAGAPATAASPGAP